MGFTYHSAFSAPASATPERLETSLGGDAELGLIHTIA
jgi:hypothetical protein